MAAPFYTTEFKNVTKVDTEASPVSSEADAPDWTAEEEKRVVRKLDMSVMAILIATFIGLQLDRSNIANALTDNFMEDVGISQDQFNVGQQLLYLGIVILEIPSTMILYAVGPRLWISGQALAWGLVSIFQAFQHGNGAYLATRLLLGLCEAGFIPASLYTITGWYKNSEISTRCAFFFLGNFFATALGGLLAYGILHMRGVAGLTGWQWLFILEGMYAFVAGVVLLLLLPDHRDNPFNFAKISFFTERDRYIMARRIPLDDPRKIKQKPTISLRDLGSYLGKWSLWPHLLTGIATIGPVTALNTYAPTLVAGYGYDPLEANALVSIGMWIQICLTPIFGWIADRTQRRGLVMLTSISLWFLFLIGNYAVIDNPHPSTRLALLITALCFTQSWHPVNISWMALNAASPAERSIRMACVIMSVNLAGVYGAQVFREDDAPMYHRAWKVEVAVVSLGLASGIFTNIMYRVMNRKSANKEENEGILKKRWFL